MIPRILKGNDFQLTINVNNKSEDSAFNIADAETITIYIIGANKSKYEFTNYTIKDNVISGTCTYILTPQYYNVEILVYKDKVHYRSYQVGQFQVVSNNSQAGLSSNIEFDADKVVNVYCEFGSGTDVTKSYVDSELATKLNITDYKASDVDKSYVDSQLSGKQDKGNYLTEIPDEYITETELTAKGYALNEDLKNANSSISDISTRLNGKQDKGNYLTSIPSEYITESELNSKGYLTEHQSLTNYATVSDLKNSNSSISDISTRLLTKLDKSSYVAQDVTKSYVDSELEKKQNVGNYLTSIPDEYITESELNSKGYLTEHQSLTNYATVSDLKNSNSSISDISTRLSTIHGDVTKSYVDDISTRLSADIINLSSTNSSISDISTRLQTKLDKSSYVAPDVTKSYVDSELEKKQDKGNYATVESVNNANSSINDISTRVKKNTDNISLKLNTADYIKPDVTKYYVDSELSKKQNSGNYATVESVNTVNSSIKDISTRLSTLNVEDITDRLKNIKSIRTSIVEGDIDNNVIGISARYSHAEGQYTTAAGTSSHAEGEFTLANAIASHAEGQNTVAYNDYEHASGKYNKSNKTTTTFGDSGNTLFSIGNGTSNTKRKNAFEVQQDGSIFVQGISGTIQNYVSDISTRLNTDINNLSIANSSITDISTRLSNIHGDVTLSYVDDISTRLTTDINNLSVVNSSISDISTRLQTKLDKSSYVAADVTKSYVDTQLATKQNSGNYLTSDSLTPVNSSISDISTRLSKVSGGVTKNYVDDISTRLRTDINNLSVSNTSISDISTRIKNIISTGTAIIEGDIKNNTANGSHAHAEGENNTADGYRSHAEGMNNVASSNCAHAEGMFNTATGVCAHAEGWNTATNNGSEHASGQYNKSNTSSTTFGNSGNTLFSIGFGTSDTDRKNAFEIRQDGSIYTTGITEPIQIYVKDISTRLKSQYSFDSATGVLNITTV